MANPGDIRIRRPAGSGDIPTYLKPRFETRTVVVLQYKRPKEMSLAQYKRMLEKTVKTTPVGSVKRQRAHDLLQSHFREGT